MGKGDRTQATLESEISKRKTNFFFLVSPHISGSFNRCLSFYCHFPSTHPRLSRRNMLGVIKGFSF